MADTLTQSERSRVMSRVRSEDTKPEWVLRSALHRLGFRYRLRPRDLPGKPDLVFPKYRCAVFVHGCFWHRHPRCRYATTPKSNTEFWEEKFRRNTKRDAEVAAELRARGWRVLTAWECELRDSPVETVRRIAEALLCRAEETPPLRYEDLPDRNTMLRAAEQKVHYRLRKSDGP